MPFRLEFKSKHGVEFAGFLDRSTDALKDNQSRIRCFYFSHFQRLRFLGGNDFSSWKIFWRRRGLVLGSNFVFLAERWRRQCLNAGLCNSRTGRGIPVGSPVGGSLGALE